MLIPDESTQTVFVQRAVMRRIFPYNGTTDVHMAVAHPGEPLRRTPNVGLPTFPESPGVGSLRAEVFMMDDTIRVGCLQ